MCLKVKFTPVPGNETKCIVLLGHLLFKSLRRKSSANFMWKHTVCQKSESCLRMLTGQSDTSPSLDLYKEKMPHKRNAML